MPDSYKKIRIEEIDISDQRYNIFSAVSQKQPFLTESLKEIGLIAPPIVRPHLSDSSEDNAYIIISGFNRISALHASNINEVMVHLKDRGTEDYECLLIAVADLAFRRPLTQAELILAINKLSSFFDKDTLSQKSPAVFNLKLSEKYIQDMLDVGALPNPTLELINKGKFALKAAKKLCSLENESAQIFLKLFSHLKFSLNIQLEIIRNMSETATVEAVSIPHLYEIMGLEKFLEDESIDRPAMAHRIRHLIYKRRYPTLSKAQQELKDTITALKLPDTMKINLPDTFESRKFSISLTVNKPDDLDTNAAALNNPVVNTSLKEIVTL